MEVAQVEVLQVDTRAAPREVVKGGGRQAGQAVVQEAVLAAVQVARFLMTLRTMALRGVASRALRKVVVAVARPREAPW